MGGFRIYKKNKTWKPSGADNNGPKIQRNANAEGS